MKTELMNKMTRTIGKAGLKLKKHSPEILITVGVVGTVASAVMACKATTKISTILGDAKEQINTIHEVVEDPKMSDRYSVEDSKKDLTIVYAQTGWKLVKLYGPSIALGAVSIGCILASNNIIRKRNIALAAAYTTIDKSFKEYRGRVVERFGKELDHELRHNIKAMEIEEKVMNEDGTESVVTKTVNAVDPTQYSDYARFFDDGCLGWDKDPELNLYTVRQVQNYANELLQTQGYLFLNDVYKMLGIPVTKAGQQVGWIYDTSKGNGDGFVDFGLYDLHNTKARDFVNGHERVILLDFNVDGVILDLI